MIVSSRSLVALGLGVIGAGLLVGPSLGQQEKSAKPAAPAPPVVGTVDVGAVLKGYEKVKVLSEEFKAAALAKQNELMKISSEAQQEAEMLQKMTPGSPDFKKHEDKITTLKAQMEAGREQAQRDFSLRESEMMATLYKEIQEWVAAIAKHRGMTYILKVSNDPIAANNPNAVFAAIEKSVVYADPRNDITRDVLFNMNRNYQANSGTKPKASTPATAGGNAAPAAN
ncbi:MAG: OmpH family outer membrane protein [Isosphaeraceae bacterium]|nr:OmpH family outer membrane protein [Isosphaeraceae bacterium]